MDTIRHKFLCFTFCIPDQLCKSTTSILYFPFNHFFEDIPEIGIVQKIAIKAIDINDFSFSSL